MNTQVTENAVTGEYMSAEEQAEHTRLLNLGLPKWPHLMIVGDKVTTDQAEEIIFRTETFLTDISEFAGGNNKRFNERYRRDSGMAAIDYPFPDEAPNDYWKNHFGFAVMESVREFIGFIPLQYLHNTWASSCFIGGPYGFCSPDGDIFYQDNVGKWPSVEAVYEDFCAIAKAFPYLNLKATLYNGESCEEENIESIVSFVVSNGEVRINQEDYKLRETHFVERDFMEFFTKRHDESREQGLSEKFLSYARSTVRNAIKECLPDAIKHERFRLDRWIENSKKEEAANAIETDAGKAD